MPDPESRSTLLIAYGTAEPPFDKHGCYLKGCLLLQNIGNQPVTGDIRFTVGKTAFKGGRTFLFVTARISMYVTDNSRCTLLTT